MTDPCDMLTLTALDDQQSRFKVKTDVGENSSFKKSLWQFKGYYEYLISIEKYL